LLEYAGKSAFEYIFSNFVRDEVKNFEEYRDILRNFSRVSG